MKKLLMLAVLFLSQIVFSQSDCITAIPVCGNSDLSYNSNSSGTIPEQTSASCLALEHYSVWYVFTAATTGTIEFTITPFTVPGVTHYDYDFAVYGPNIDCTTWDFGNAIKCNFDGTTGPTGLSSTITGDQWETPLDVVAGETYYLLIDNYIPGNPYGFSLTWGGTATLTSAFNDPALTPNPFITPGTPAANPSDPNEIFKCALPTMFDFTTLTAGIVNGNPNFTVSYHLTQNDAVAGTAPITTPIMVNGTDIYYYRIKYEDPTNPANPANGCFQVGRFKFKQGNIVVQNATLTACNNNNTGFGSFDLTSANVYNPTGITKKYYPTLADLNAGTNEITNPSNYYSTAPKTVYVKVTTSEGCVGSSQITLQFLPPLTVTPVTLLACNNNNMGTGTFDLTSANVYPASTNVTKKYYLTQADLNAGTNEILNPAAYVSAPKTIYVKVITPQGCTGSNVITLQFHPAVTVNDASIEECYIDTNVTSGSFDLTSVSVSSVAGHTKKYYKTQADAIAATNEILNPGAYIATTSVVYVRVISENNCFAIAKISLKVLPPVQSNVLKDKIICIEDTTVLDAGPGFAAYEWSTGATTQSISNVSPGAYWVKLKTGKCWTLQQVNVKASVQPVITSIDITNDSFTVIVNGGKAPYKYSLDGVNWQDSNVFTGLPRGENKVYVKDSYDCNPIDVQVTVPNLLNAITPNGDNKNDYIDYSALAYKKNLVFTVYDRYGNMLYKADKIRDYTWDGTSNGKKILTGTYWYTISWNENDKNNTETKYSGWVLVKNIE
ncbi:gliding motility-associated C-terminal domain-containing protein [Chryseobacterium arachidis]|uniref:Gliding motility-associated C-terminal domain-containing protein n=1 Tax=Chryseobacterium arachidis TaxID=1416778 RepID=A0A1M4XKH2_9FLAO|nr:T9SS type B sorting domain-containing protein [Chryseobacterium arachidis]SHE93999.1 gliding motility-associated C-terminal domain-containing protein [Chryseobacterium arachidis]